MQSDLFSLFEEVPQEPAPKETSKQGKKQKQDPADVRQVENTNTKEDTSIANVMDTPSPKDMKQYTPDEIMKSSIDYFGGDELAANVWMNKYALRDGDTIFELNPDMMHHRLAVEFARIENKYPNPLSEGKSNPYHHSEYLSYHPGTSCSSLSTQYASPVFQDPKGFPMRFHLRICVLSKERNQEDPFSFLLQEFELQLPDLQCGFRIVDHSF